MSDTYAAAPAPRFRVNQRDTISMISVVVLTLVALIAGYFLMDSVQGRMATYEAPGGIAVSYPDGWQVDTSQANNGTISFRDITSPSAPTVFRIQTETAQAARGDQEALGEVANSLTLSRAQELEVYKVLDLQGNQQIKGLPGLITTYTFVQVPQDVFRDHLPVVMVGEDRLVKKGESVYVFTMHSSEENEEEARERFDAFVESTRLP